MIRSQKFECCIASSFKCCFLTLFNGIHTLCSYCSSWVSQWPAFPMTSAFRLAVGSLLLWLLNHILSAREPSTQFALQEPAYFCWPRRASHMTSFACLEIAQSKDFSAVLSLHLFQILQIPLCSLAQNFSRWSSKRKNMSWCSIPLSCSPYLYAPWSLFSHPTLFQGGINICFFFWSSSTLHYNFLFFFAWNMSINS